jgi:hypothetical protein
MPIESSIAFTGFQYELEEQPSEPVDGTPYKTSLASFELATYSVNEEISVSEESIFAATSGPNFDSDATAKDDHEHIYADEDVLFIGNSESTSVFEVSVEDGNLIIASALFDITNKSVDEADPLLSEADSVGSLINTGDGNDYIEFLGNVSGSVVELGAGMDKAIFYGDITDTIIDLGGDDVRDELWIDDPSANFDGLVIEGAGAEDVLFIGSSEYSYQGNYTWQNITDPGDERLIGP